MATPQDGPFVILTLEFRKDDGYWLGRCRELGTATDGRSLERVSQELIELVALHLAGLADTGEQERVLADRGVTVYSDILPAMLNTQVPVKEDGSVLVQLWPVPLDAPRRTLAAA